MSKLNDTTRGLVQTSYYLFMGNTLSTIILTLTTLLEANLLNPEDYGLYALSLTIPLFLADLCDFGISSALTRFSARLVSKEEENEALLLIKNGLLFKLVLLVPSALGLYILSDNIALYILNRPNIAPLIRFTPLLVVGQGIYLALNSAFIGLDRAKYSFLIMGLNAIVKAVFSISLILLDFGSIGAIMGAVLGLVSASILGALLFFRLSSSNHRIQAKTIRFLSGSKPLIAYGLPIYFTKILLSFIMQYQFFILALFTTNAEIGNFTVSRNFSALMLILIYPVENSLFSAFSKLNIEEDRPLLEKIFKEGVRYASMLIIPVSLFLVIQSKETIFTLYGSAYTLAPHFLSMYITVFLLVGLGRYIIQKFFDGQGATKNTLKIVLVKGVVIISLAPILTYSYGVFGLLAAFLISEFALILYALRLLNRNYALVIEWIESVRILIAGIFSMILVMFFKQVISFTNNLLTLILNGSIFLISFLIFLPFIGAITELDVERIESMTQSLSLIKFLVKPILKFERTLIILSQKIRELRRHFPT